MGKFLKALASIKLAIALIAYLAASGLLSTLVPQGLEPGRYRELYPPFLADLVVRTGFGDFFRSILFLVPAFAFFVNLAACTVLRALREVSKEGKRRFGSLVLHLGLLALVLGAALSFWGRRSGSASLAEGESTDLVGGISLTLVDFTATYYPDGRPEGWTSLLRIGGSGEPFEYALKVNSPLRLGTLSLYQASYGSEDVLTLRDPSGAAHELRAGQYRQLGEERAAFAGRDPATGKAMVYLGGTAVAAGPGEKAGPFEVAALASRELSVIEVVEDPGYPIVLASLALAGLGIFITMFRKLGDMKP